MGLRGKRAALTLSPKVRLQMTLHVSKENSSWMATGVPAWALMRCRGETGYMGCGDRGKPTPGGPGLRSSASPHRIPGPAALPGAPWSLACPASELSERVSYGPSTLESSRLVTGPSLAFLQEGWWKDRQLTKEAEGLTCLSQSKK